jgi:hypothetical protein
MNVGGAGVMDGLALAAIRADVSALIGDADTGVSVTWLPQGSRSWNTGLVSYNGTPATLTGFLGPLSTREIEHTQGAKVGDVKLLLVAADLTTPPKVDDAFRVGTTVYTVYHLETSSLSTHYALMARKAVS